jgi:hypothetical protein
MARSSTATSSRSTVPPPTSDASARRASSSAFRSSFGMATRRRSLPADRSASSVPPPARTSSSRAATFREGRSLPLRRLLTCPGLQGTARASSRTPMPHASIRRESSVPKSLMLRVPIRAVCLVLVWDCGPIQTTSSGYVPRPFDCRYPVSATRIGGIRMDREARRSAGSGRAFGGCGESCRRQQGER